MNEQGRDQWGGMGRVRVNERQAGSESGQREKETEFIHTVYVHPRRLLIVYFNVFGLMWLDINEQKTQHRQGSIRGEGEI